MTTRRQFLAIVPACLVVSACSFDSDTCTSKQQKSMEKIFSYIRSNLKPVTALLPNSKEFEVADTIAAIYKQTNGKDVADDAAIRGVLSQSMIDDANSGRFVTYKNLTFTKTEAFITLVAGGGVSSSTLNNINNGCPKET